MHYLGLLLPIISNLLLLRIRCSYGTMRNSHLPHDCCNCTLILNARYTESCLLSCWHSSFLLVHEYLVLLLISCFWRLLGSCAKYHQISALSIHYYKVKAWAWIPLAIFVYSTQQRLAKYSLKYKSYNEKMGLTIPAISIGTIFCIFLHLLLGGIFA